MIAVWESDISATFLKICLKLLTDTAFFRHLGKLFHNIAPLQEKLRFLFIHKEKYPIEGKSRGCLIGYNSGLRPVNR